MTWSSNGPGGHPVGTCCEVSAASHMLAWHHHTLLTCCCHVYGRVMPLCQRCCSLHETPCNDVCVHCWCSPCAVCQEVRPGSVSCPLGFRQCAGLERSATGNNGFDKRLWPMQCILRSRNRWLQHLHALAETQSLCEELLLLRSIVYRASPQLCYCPCRHVSSRHKLPGLLLTWPCQHLSCSG